ncbi:MAG TPA: hypothetical protein PK955_03830 [Methanoregulaceae archaeon]|nr:hypothetical protein [Methanoregulaceae archaeon]
MTYGGLTFWHDVEGNSRIPGGLSFSHSVAGTLVLSFDGHSEVTPELKRVLSISAEFDGYSLTNGDTERIFRFIREFDAHSTAYGEFETVLNAGSTSIIKYGSIILSNAKPIKGEYLDRDFSSCETIMHDGSLSIQTNPIVGYYSRFMCICDDYNEIENLLAMVGRPYTLRVRGRPIRNCYIMPPIKELQIKDQFARWVYIINFKQATAEPGVSD